MTDQNSADDEAPQAANKGFDWLVESHQQSSPMAPLTEEIPIQAPSPVPSSSQFIAPPPIFAPSSGPSLATAPPPAPVAAPSEQPPAFVMPAASSAGTSARSSLHDSVHDSVQGSVEESALRDTVLPPPVFRDAELPEPAAPGQAEASAPLVPVGGVGPLISMAPPPAAESSRSGFPLLFTDTPAPQTPAAPAPFVGDASVRETFSGERFSADQPGLLGLARTRQRSRSANGVLDWVAFALAFLAPPIGLLLGIVAVVFSSTNRGYAASVAKAAIGIGAALTLVLGVGLAVTTKLNNDQAAHNAIVASSRAYCAKLKASPTLLASSTFDWPAPAGTIPESIPPMQSYVNTWKSILGVAPSGIRADTQKIETTAASIVASVQSTQTLDDASNVAQMQNVVNETGIKSWVSSYCQ